MRLKRRMEGGGWRECGLVAGGGRLFEESMRSGREVLFEREGRWCKWTVSLSLTPATETATRMTTILPPELHTCGTTSRQYQLDARFRSISLPLTIVTQLQPRRRISLDQKTRTSSNAAKSFIVLTALPLLAISARYLIPHSVLAAKAKYRPPNLPTSGDREIPKYSLTSSASASPLTTLKWPHQVTYPHSAVRQNSGLA